MRKTTLVDQFNAQNIDQQYQKIWNKGDHLRTIDDKNRDFYYSIFYVDFLFVEVIYSKLDNTIIAIRSFTDIQKLMFYLNEDFS